MNEKFVEIFTNMAAYENSLKRVFPAKAYINAVKIFKELDFEVDEAEQIKGIKGIGDGIFKKVDSFLKTGSFPRYEEYLQSDVAKCKEVASIKGFGMNKAKKLFEAGIKSLNELKNKVKDLKIGDPLIDGMNFTKAMKIGLDYEAHTDKTRITVKQHDEIANPLLEVIKELGELVAVIRAEVVGSRRRFDGSENYTIGDIDIIIEVPKHEHYLSFVQHSLEIVLDEVVMSGETKVSGILNSRQVDFRIVKEDEGYEALRLYATGPVSFNVKCRKEAIKNNLILNEYGLFEKDTKKLITNKEVEILEKLGIGWVDPKDRKNF